MGLEGDCSRAQSPTSLRSGITKLKLLARPWRPWKPWRGRNLWLGRIAVEKEGGKVERWEGVR